MNDIFQAIKEFATFIGEKLDAIANREPASLNVRFPDAQKVSLDGIETITLKGEPGDTPTDEHLLELIIPNIPPAIPGKPGHTPTKTELNKLIVPLIPKEADLKKLIKPLIPDLIPPTDEELQKLIKPMIPDPIPGSPDTGEEIVEKINKDKSGKVIKKEHVEGIKDIESDIKTLQSDVTKNSGFFMKFAGDTVRTYDLSSLLNGVTKVFTLPTSSRVLIVTGSSFPYTFRPNIDYTTTSQQITFTSTIDESTILSSGQTIVLLYIVP